MSPNVLILLLRIGAAALLYLFLLGAVSVIWRDWRALARQTADRREADARTLGRLVVVDRGSTDLMVGYAFPLGVITGLGRTLTNTVVIDDSFTSAEHAVLSLRSGRWWLEDKGSKNGTRLNGERLNAPAIVATGDEIGIGGVRLRIELE